MFIYRVYTFEKRITNHIMDPVSYTHLDVYKRQGTCYVWYAMHKFSGMIHFKQQTDYVEVG